MKNRTKSLHCGVALMLASIGPSALFGSSHMDAPLITLDPAANTADVYAFRSGENGRQYLSTALTVYPFEEPGIGPNSYRFDDNVLYEIHVATSNDLAAGRATISYQFAFQTSYANSNTILQAYLGIIQNVGDANQNLRQTYTVTKVDRRRGRPARTVLGRGVVPPNNQGVATPKYNQGDNGDNPAKSGATTTGELDAYTAQSITTLSNGYKAFAGQRDDGFYGDILAIFDLLQFRNPGVDAQGGFNLHTIALNIPLSDLGGASQTIGVYATTSRRQISILRNGNGNENGNSQNGSRTPVFPNHNGDGNGNPPVRIETLLNDSNNGFVQVGRQGNPLFCEGLVAIADKDRYNRTKPTEDNATFRKYALNPELAKLINAIVFNGTATAPETNRTDLAGIFIPDLIKVDLSTGPVPLAGGFGVPNDEGFSRLSVFGGDTVQSQLTGGAVPSGWPNGRRFGDDVVDIAITAVASDLRVTPPIIVPLTDNVDGNDIAYNKVFPYSATPLNGRKHTHHGQ